MVTDNSWSGKRAAGERALRRLAVADATLNGRSASRHTPRKNGAAPIEIARRLMAASASASSGGDALLRIRNLSAGYGLHSALRDVHFEVRRGECVAVLGANGAGKSSLLCAISGTAITVRHGAVVFDGKRVTDMSPTARARAGICHIPEGRSVFPSLTVQENLRLFGARDLSKQDEVVSAFPRLGERLRQIAGTLSGGEQQMLAMVPAVVQKPALLLVDEVSLGLAPVIVNELYDFLGTVSQAGSAVVIVEQFADRALALSDRAYVLGKGHIVHSGPAKELVGQADALRELYLGQSVNGALVARVPSRRKPGVPRSSVKSSDVSTKSTRRTK